MARTVAGKVAQTVSLRPQASNQSRLNVSHLKPAAMCSREDGEDCGRQGSANCQFASSSQQPVPLNVSHLKPAAMCSREDGEDCGRQGSANCQFASSSQQPVPFEREPLETGCDAQSRRWRGLWQAR